MIVEYDYPVNIADNIYWVGFFDKQSGLHCNPYLVVDGEEAVLIDAGSRPDFPTIMTKILQTGTDPSTIRALIFQHYDPDLCGGASNFEEIIGRDDLQIIAARENHMFIRHYGIKSDLIAVEDLGYAFRFGSGRTLRFFHTPYCHASGAMVTFDEASGVLFTSDLFGSYYHDWALFLDLHPQCLTCPDYLACPLERASCPILDIMEFHRMIMPSPRALRHSLHMISSIPFSMIAPQHGSVIRLPEDMTLVFEALYTLKGVGIDQVFDEQASASENDGAERVRTRLGVSEGRARVPD